MKYLFACLMLVASYSTAAAQVVVTPVVVNTCDQRARECRRLGLGGACIEPFRMATCRKTGVYTAPNGRTAEANGR